VGCATSRSRAWLALLLLAGLWLRLWGLDYGLPLPAARPDEEALVPRFVTFDGGDPNPHWFMYPTLSIYLTYGWVKGALLGGRAAGVWRGPTDIATLATADPRTLYLLARLLSALLGTAAIAVTYHLGRLLGGRRAGLVAALLLTVSFLHVRESHFFKPDAILSLFVAGALVACVVLQRRGTGRAAALAGLACGLALSVKYTASLAVPLVLAVFLGPAGPGRPSRGARLLIAASAAAAAAVGGSPYTLLAWSEFAAWARFTHLWVQYGGAGFATPFGYHLTHSFLAAQGLPLTVFALGALVWGLRIRNLLPIAAFLLAAFLQLGLASAAYTRYLTPFLPALYALAGVAFVRLAERLGASFAGRAVAAGLLLVLVARPLHSAVRFDQIVAARDTRLLAADWLSARVARGTPVLVLGSDWPYVFGDPVLDGYRVRRNPTLDPKLGIRYVLTHEHPLPFSRIPAEFEALRPALRLEQTFSPFAGDTVPADALFELRDAFYVPLTGFGEVVRGGPLIHIYRVVAEGENHGAS
jgi:4-amino-4-deoxy-L-arabinose transferase-like glycosyltransferase